ncbi:MAG: M36 family metallopeptidase [Actinomycetes bacterium]
MSVRARPARRFIARRSIRQLPIIAITALALAAALPAVAAGQSARPGAGDTRAKDLRAEWGNYDTQSDLAAKKTLAAKSAQLSAHPNTGVRSLRKHLGTQAIVDIDPLTGTPRLVGRLDGFLTGPSTANASAVALGYLRSHAEAFGLSAADIGRLTLRKDYVDITGTHHLNFIQTVGGIPVFGNGLKAHVTKTGRLISVLGSPVANLPTAAARPSLSAAMARELAISNVGRSAKAAIARPASGVRRTTAFRGGDLADLVYFQTPAGLRLAWQTMTAPSTAELYQHVMDAATGRTLYRRSLVNDDGSGLVWDNYPGAPRGGNQIRRTISGLPNNSPRLAGNAAHVYSDINDDNAAQASEEIGPTGSRRFDYPFVNFNSLGDPCSAAFPCSWNPDAPFSWQTNRGQNSVQVAYWLGKFHDHLAAAPIGFTRAAGNFEAVDGDAINAETFDGANTAGGLPDGNHVDNANMATPVDGIPPRMQMFLFHTPPLASGDPFLPSNGGDPGDIVYHEYTHGLSNRLVVDPLGNSTLGALQAGAMGEAWGDWYGYDLLVKGGFERDTPAHGELIVGNYVEFGGQGLVRSEGLDCPVGSTAPACPGTPLTGPGGYTYGDYGNVIGVPEVHADGEIWAQTLWDLRVMVGARLAESLVTRAMELSPNNPSFLDMRNSILQADQVVNGGKANKTIWSVFAGRGMGYFAGSVDGDDITPAEDFSLPPPPGTPTGVMSGTVTDADTGVPLEGALVGFGGHASGFPGDLAALTDADGNYTITEIVAGTYPRVFARGPGYDVSARIVSVSSNGVTPADYQLRRDWAGSSGGGEVIAFNGPDFSSFGCGPPAIIDQSLGIGWNTTSDFVGGVATPKFVVIKLPVAVDVSEIAVDPTANCGDGGSASTGDFRLETSTDGVTFVTAATGTFGVANRGQLNSIPLNPGTTDNVQYVRWTELSPQIPGGFPSCPGFAGCTFMDTTELEVYGLAAE